MASQATSTDLIALPMHGEAKLRKEGYRTRDGHLLEWIGRLRPASAVTVRSRPEPFPRVTLARRHGYANPAWTWESPEPIALPSMRARRRWWVDSLRYENRDPVSCQALLAWNPIAAAHLLDSTIKPERFVFDLLDDWSVHILFEPIRAEVEEAYARVFDRATAVTANSEGTVRLAARFGREAELVANGCDPEYFAAPGDRRSGSGPTVVGYAGKLSERLDVELFRAVATSLPQVQFVIAGPLTVATREAAQSIKALGKLGNVRLLGNVPYGDLPDLVCGWDIGWVPHRVGELEVGGDAIKTYEYRAAGLPVVTTPIIGTERVMSLGGITAVNDADEATAAITELIEASGAHPPRIPARFEGGISWREKTERILKLLGI